MGIDMSSAFDTIRRTSIHSCWGTHFTSRDSAVIHAFISAVIHAFISAVIHAFISAVIHAFISAVIHAFISLLICASVISSAYQLSSYPYSYSLFYGYYTPRPVHLISDMPTVAERYKFNEVENDGRKFLLETAKLCKVDCFELLTTEIANKAGNKGELLSIFVPAMKLMERQHKLIMNQRVHVKCIQVGHHPVAGAGNYIAGATLVSSARTFRHH